MARTRTKVAPTHYPFLPFHGLRCAQLVSSLVVGAVMFYFDWHLTHDGWSIPWTFIVLTTVACLTILFLTATIVLHCCCGLNPRLNILLNVILVCLWGLGFGLLTWWARGTLGHWCNAENWNDETGIMVCRIYKALFAFSLTGFVSTIAALALDIYVFKRSTARGRYNQMQDPIAGTTGKMGYRDVSMNMGHYNVEPKQDQSGHGYSVPEEQFDYDTTYHGAHAQRVLS